MPMVSARDFITILKWDVDENGVVTIFCFSIDREDLVPLVPNVVRAGIPIGCWRLEVVQENPCRIKAMYLCELDFRGSVPLFLLTKALKDQSIKLVKVRELAMSLDNKN